MEEFANAFLVPLNSSSLDRAVTIMARYHVKSFDAIHASTALSARVDFLASIDADFLRVTELPCIVLGHG